MLFTSLNPQMTNLKNNKNEKHGVSQGEKHICIIYASVILHFAMYLLPKSIFFHDLMESKSNLHHLYISIQCQILYNL